MKPVEPDVPLELAELVVLDLDSPVSPFQQIRDQIAAAVEEGVLRPEVRLPPVRRLATHLGLAVNTVARSYRELELAGVVETRGRHGTFVRATPSPRRKLASREARNFARRLRALGIGTEEMFSILGHELERLGPAPGSQSRSRSRSRPK
jgi:DNA-binding transcriptional regulator YhcF (GntR family)